MDDWHVLGLDGDPTPGDPVRTRELAGRLREQADLARRNAARLRTVAANDNELRMEGDYAALFRQALAELPDELAKLERAYQGCGDALGTYSDSLTDAKTKSSIALTRGRDADAAYQGALNRIKAALPPDRAGLLPAGTGALAAVTLDALTLDLDETTREHIRQAVRSAHIANGDRDRARRLARDAADLRGTAEQRCVDGINAALEDSGIKNKEWHEKALDFVTTPFRSWDDFVNLCKNVATVLGVVAIFLSGPLALAVAAVLLLTTIVAVADTARKVHRGQAGWGELALEGAGLIPGGKLAQAAGRFRTGARGLTNGGGRTLQAGLKSDPHPQMSGLVPGDQTRNVAPRQICTKTGHPVDVASGKVFTEHVDLALPGPLPFAFERVWYSTSTYQGPLGNGWHHSYDAAMYVTNTEVVYRTRDGRAVHLPALSPDSSHFERTERLTFARDSVNYTVTEADGITLLFTPEYVGTGDGHGLHQLRQVRNRAGHRIALTYDERGLLSELVDSGQRRMRLEHDQHGHITALTAPHPDLAGQRHTVTRYDYDELGNLSAMTDALGQVLRYGYEGQLLVRETDRTGMSFYFEYDGTDEQARCLRTWGDGGIYDHRLRYEVGATTVRNSLGHETRHEHEGGLVTRTIDAQGGESRTRFEHGQPVEAVDALGRVTTYAYDARGNQVSVVRPDGSTVESTFDERDLPVSAVDAVGGEWAWTYDDAGLLRERRDPLGRTWRFDYASGLLTSVTDPAGGVTALAHDEQGSITRVTTPDGASSGWRRNALSWPVVATDPLGNDQVRQFDLAGRVVRVEEPDGNVRQLEYDGEGNLVLAVDRLYDVRFSYQGLGRLASREQAGTTVRFEYDTEEQLTGVVNEHGHVYRFAHGPTGEVTTERGFDGVLRLYERDVLGRVVSVRRASGLVTGYRYDDADRVTTVEHSDGTGERLAYRADGALMLAENETIQVRYERDVLGRVTREWQGEHWIDSEYDALGFRARVRSSLGFDETIERNAVGDVTAVRANGFQARFTRDALGQELTRELPGGVRSRWHRDKLGRPVRHEVTTAAGAVRDRTYKWDVDDRLRGVVDALTGPILYEHDALGQLVSATYRDGRVELRMPDAVGNLFRTRDRSDRVYGPAGQLLEAVDQDGRLLRYSYDAEGYLLEKVRSDGAVWSYRWSAAGSLTQVLRPDGLTVEFMYDALARRVCKASPAGSVSWVWDKDVPLHESFADLSTSAPTAARHPSASSASSPSLNTLLFVPDTFGPLAQIGQLGPISGITDHLGTPVLWVSGEVAVVHSGEVTIWGSCSQPKTNPCPSPLRWPGQYEDEETGLHWNRYRYYDPESGQYISPDPIGLRGGRGLYRYVRDVVALVDVFGLAGCGPDEPGGGLRDEHIIVRGGTSDLPPAGDVFSGAYGATLEEAAAAVPYGQIRPTTVGAIRSGGGSVEIVPEMTRSGVMNERHVNIVLGDDSAPFGPLQPNPVHKSGRIQ